MTFISVEMRRLLRNRRTIVMTLVIPAVFVFLFTNNKRARAGGPGEVALIMVGLGVYGAMLAATAGGSMVAVERALGWSRQLRLTPLRPLAYIAIKMSTAMLLGLASVVIVYLVNAFRGEVSLALGDWLLTGFIAWVGGLVFAAFGVFMGYLLPSENVMQILGPVLGVFALFGGLFLPVNQLPSTMQSVAPWTPPWGVAAIARYPLTHGGFDWMWLVSVAAWLAVFAVGAAILFRRDTRRV